MNGFPIYYSDETADDHNVNRGGNPSGVGWRLNRQTSSNRSRDSQEITYVPTSILKGNHNTGSKNPPDDPEVGSNPHCLGPVKDSRAHLRVYVFSLLSIFFRTSR